MTFTVSLDSAKEWAKFTKATAVALPPWLHTVITFLLQMNGKSIKINVEIVDD